MSKATDVAPLSVDNEINTVVIANANTNSQTDDNMQVWKKTEIVQLVILASVYAGPDAQFQLNTPSDGDAIDAIPLPLLWSKEAFFSV